MNSEAKKAIRIGLLCTIAYLAVYVARNMLGVVSPGMIETGRYTEAYIGTISTGYLIAYACGQLINGAIGDKIISRYMISGGLLGAGLCNIALPFAPDLLTTTVLYSVSGFFLSMIYGPMTKTVSENVKQEHAARAALGYTIASFLGSPAAGVVAMLTNWQNAFLVCGGILTGMGVISFLSFLRLEKAGLIVYRFRNDQRVPMGVGLKRLLEHHIIKYAFVATLTGIVRTTVVFWVPTYLAQYLHFTPTVAVAIFSGVTLAMSVGPFVDTLLVYEKLFKRNRGKTVLCMFSISAAAFLLMFLWKQPVFSVVMLTLALVANGGASTMLWSTYCPSLHTTGLVSTATGFLDFMSYMGAAAANLAFSNAVAYIGWGWLILSWAGLMGIGVLVGLKKE